ncbi:MAG: FMN-binding protein [Epulopiscium sp.]|nr:FMN-binding protein [Candidatus Epulonipiscium sp.]
MRMKKWIVVGLAAGISLSMFSGCQKDSSKSDTAVTNTLLQDGTWTAEADTFDDHGWKPTVSIKVEGNKITEVIFDYVNENGQLKKEDEGYNIAMKGKSGTSPEEAFPQLEQELIEKQNVDNIDVVTGATVSSEDFKTIAKKALEKAHE